MREILLTSSVLILVIILLRAILGKKISMRLRYGLWILVVIRLLLPIQISHSTLSVQNVLQETPQKETVIVVPSVNYETSEVQVYQAESTQDENHYETLICRIWYIGIGAMALWIIPINFAFYCKARKNAKRLHLSDTSLRVFVTDGVSSPCLMGRTIFLTPEIAEDEARRNHVLAHELTHYYHADSLWSIVRAVCLCVYWFHPLVWCAAILSKRDCELACDEGAIKRLGESERYSYGETLVCVAAQASKAPVLHTATTISLSKKHLTERIKAIAKKQKRSVIAVVLLCAVLAVTAVVVFTGSAEQKNEPVEEQELQIQQTATQVTVVSETTAEITEASEQTTTEEQATQEITTQELTQEQTTTSAQSEEIAKDKNYLGTITIEAGDKFSTIVPYGEYTIVSVGGGEVARAYLSMGYNDRLKGYWTLSITAYREGSAYLYSDRGNLLAVIKVVEKEKETDGEIDYTDFATQQPSFEPPTFGFP